MLPDRGFVSPFGAQATCPEGWSWDWSTAGTTQAAPYLSCPHQGFLRRPVGVLPSGGEQSEGPLKLWFGLRGCTILSSGQLESPWSLALATGGMYNMVSRGARRSF